MDFAVLAKKSSLSENTHFCPKCCNEQDFSKMTAKEITQFIQESELGRRDKMVTYRLDAVIADQIKKHDLVYSTPEQIKETLLNKKSGLVKEIRSSLRTYVGLLPRDIRRQGRKLEINLWGQEVI